MITISLALCSCDKQGDLVPRELDTATIVPSWLIPSDFPRGDDKGLLFILSESYVNSTSFDVPVRVLGNVKDPATGKNTRYASIEIGSINLPAPEGTSSDPSVGVVHDFFAPSRNKDDHLAMVQYQGTTVDFSVNETSAQSETGRVDIPYPLRAGIRQEQAIIQDYGKLDPTKSLIVHWPTDSPTSYEPRAGSIIRDFVGAAILQAPDIENGEMELPDDAYRDVITVGGDFDLGELEITREQLANFPDDALLAIYVGRIRYEIDENGELIRIGPGGTGVVVGGTQGGTRIRNDIP